MGALTSAVIAIVGLALGWLTIEIACKPCLDKGREAIDRSLDPNYDPDEEEVNIRTPLNPNPNPVPNPDQPPVLVSAPPAVTSSTANKVI